MKKILTVAVLTTISTLTFSQSRNSGTVSGTPLAVPMKDFPLQCVALCEPQARAYDAIKNTRYSFIGCGDYPQMYGGMPGAPMSSLVNKFRTGQLDASRVIDEVKKGIQDIRTGKSTYRYTPDENIYFLLSQELNLCVLSNLSGVKHTGDLKDANSTNMNSRSRDTQNRNTGNLVNPPDSVQQQQLQAAATQAVNRARESQQRGDADAQRRGRRVHDPAAEAHECISVLQGGFGGLKNSCGYRVNVVSCNQNPRVVPSGLNWSASFDCEKGQFGLYNLDANSSEGAHTRNSEHVHWFACKAPASPLDVAYEAGELRGRCR
jgi:hypothetical protein